MSVDATRWAWSQSIKPSEKLVLLAMADRAGESNDCWPSISRLVNDTGLDRKTVLAVIGRLEEIGLLIVSKEAGKGNYYQLIGVDNRHGQSDQTGTKNGTGTKKGTGPKSGTTPVPKTGHESKKNLKIRERDNACDGFDAFWAVYPRKVSKRDAERAWQKIAPGETLQREIVAAVMLATTSEQWQRDNGQFVPYPATWLNGRRWEDELPAPVPPTVGASTAPGQPGRMTSQSSGNFVSQGGGGYASRRERNAGIGAALRRLAEQEAGQDVDDSVVLTVPGDLAATLG